MHGSDVSLYHGRLGLSAEGGMVAMPSSLEVKAGWHVYVILCSDGSLYTGITTDVARRFRQHGSGQGARYFRGRQPREVVYQESGHTRSSAARREAEIKRMTRAGKAAMVQCAGTLS